jgi:hypothetical protein
MRKFYNVELNKANAERFKVYLRANGIYFEPSACYNLVHFQVKLNEAELEMVNEYLEKL